MAENKSLDKSVTKFEEAEEMSMADLMKDYDDKGDLSVGKEITVTIIAENSDGFLANIGLKAEGLIPRSEYEDGITPPELKVGANVKVKIIDMRHPPKLSYREVVEKESWNNIKKLFDEKKHIHGTVVKSVKGGLIVNIGVDAFLPISQIDVHFVQDTEKYIGKSYEFVITEFDIHRHKVTVSRRKILDDEKIAKKKSLLESISEGQIIDGTVSNITKFGAFIDLGGIDGLLGIGEMAWYKVSKVEDLLKVGQMVRVQVSRVDKAHEKISLNMKNLSTNPWDSVSDKFPVGLTIKGKVDGVMDYGAFVELEPGVKGLLHTSEYAWNDSEAAFKRDIKQGKEIEVQVISVDNENKKISLSVKQMLPNPWDELHRQYAPGTTVKGIVQNIMPFGAFVKLPQGVQGLVHINDFSWTKRVKHPEEMVKKGDEVEVVVLEVNTQTQKVSLSIKHTQKDPYKHYKAGAIVNGKVVRVVEFGAFIELEPGIEALIKNNEMSSVKADRNQSILSEGQEVEAKIVKVDIRDRKLEVSIKKLEFDREKELVKKYANQDERPTLGQILTEDGENE